MRIFSKIVLLNSSTSVSYTHLDVYKRQLLVSPADAGRTVAQLLGEVEVKTTRTLVLEPGAYPPALVLANFKDKDVDTLLDLMKQAQVNIPLKAVVTPTSKSWVFGDLLAHLQEEHTAFTAAKETAKA